MRPEDWERAEEWFHRLAPLDVAERSERLEEISASDPDLAADVRSLLSAHDSEGLLDRLTAKLAPEAPGAGLSVAPLTGASITHYEVGKLVGRGGMGDVYRARDTRLDREVALKFLPAWLGRDPTARDRFLVEARIVSSLDHPNVCTLYDIGETDDGRLFLVMPYYEGETLKQRLKTGPMSDDEALDVALQVARGLAAAHERGIVHRDVKPGNLLLADDGRVKILDFGVAKLADVSLTRPGETPGTASYMAPEQSAGGSVDARADLWALGAVMYEMLTGARPAGPIEPESDGSGATAEGLAVMPRGLAEAVARLLAARPDERYPDARALIEDLEILAGGAGSLSPRPAPSLQRFLAELKRRHVFRVAAVYGVAGFAVIEVADMIFPRIPLPEWTVSLVVWLVLLGFPIALVLAWAFEMAPGGVRRTRSIRPAILDAIVAQPAGRRWPIGIAGLVGGLLLAAGAWFALGEPLQRRLAGESPVIPPGVTDAGEAVAVLPFRVVGTGEALDAWHEGIVHLLSHDLESIDGLRKIDPTVVMRAWEKRFGEDGEAPDPGSALQVARGLGARYAVTGTAVGSDRTIRLTADVHEVESGRPRGSTFAEAPADSMTGLVNQLSLALLRAELLPAGALQPANLSHVLTSSFPAFKAYLAGERDYRRGRYDEAAAHYVKAAELDTTFARAMYMASSAYMWAGRAGLIGEYAERAASFADRVPTRDSLLFASLFQDSPGQLARLTRLTRLYPDELGGWARLGDWLFHNGGRHLYDPERYRDAWARVIELGPLYLEGYTHLIEDAFARRDTSRIRELLDDFAKLDEERNPCPGYQLAYDAAWGTDADRARVAELLETLEPRDVRCGFTTLAVATLTTEVRERDSRELLAGGGAWAAYVFWQTLQARMMRGEISALRRILASVEGITPLDVWADRYTVHFHLTGFPDSTESETAARRLAAGPALPPVEYARGFFDFQPQNDWFWLGVKAVAEGRWQDVDSAAQRMELAADSLMARAEAESARSETDSLAIDADQSETLAGALRAYAAIVRDPGEGLARFERLLARLPSIGWSRTEPEEFLRYRVGTELLKRGELRRAERYFASFNPYHWTHYVPAQYHLGRIYEELGEPEQARERYRIFVEWWETADPELQPWVDEGRAALERLDGRRGTDTRSGR